MSTAVLKALISAWITGGTKPINLATNLVSTTFAAVPKKNNSYRRHNSPKLIQVFTSSLGTAMILWSCSATQSADVTWKTYSNSRYGFEFPYPANWILNTPDNGDGINLVSPTKDAEIRAWASHRLSDADSQPQPALKPTTDNFQTTQGVSGVLVVEADKQVNIIKLTITQGQVQYHWQGQSNSKEFAEYYRLFYYIAQEYKIRGRVPS
jgi:hypothetical protein